ncbi:SulP family inorganic anion transporter [Desertibacillus haloalkaliphilus]|uniref:SulP family inorganic anion transporter n=1 Tax=Desertibacillus haloalkaliphilus TaxID=1328930 RepID=UPI001C26DF0A|nr:solute carrier family 26 protein [Desertibacillus haloalkaliphilus]MBU8908709.1 solute carrier family 26 protein [Desertibacillus haloalkaliphilus]
MLKKFIPALNWLPNYQLDDLRGDISAGVIVAVMLIPQGMAYAMLAGLPPVVGLYASTIPVIVYALFGTSRQLSIGPVAMDSLLVFAGVSLLAEPGTDHYLSLAITLMLMVGLILFLMGVLRLGFVVNFLSNAVISGFTSAAAIIIGLSQLQHLLGVNLEADQNVFDIVWESVNRISDIHWLTLVIGVLGIVLLIGLKRYPKIPGPLVLVVVSILVVFFLRLDLRGVNIVGEVPKGLPAFSMPVFSIEVIRSLLPIALTISFIAFMEAISIAKAFATKEKYKIIPNQELIGIGLANVAGSFFSAYSVTGGFSRSAVNYQAGARTPLASLITAVLIILTLLFFTGLFYYLPNAVLASIIMAAIYKLIDVREAKKLFTIRKADGWTWVITFLATLVLGIEVGILLGILFSLLVFIGRSAYPHVAELGYIKNDRVFRNVERFPEAKTDEEVLIFRIDASLYFANMTFLESKLSEAIAEKKGIKWVILDFSGVNSIDAVAIDSLEQIMKNSRSGGIKFLFAAVKGPVMDLLKKAEWDKKYCENLKYHSIQQALTAIDK